MGEYFADHVFARVAGVSEAAHGVMRTTLQAPPPPPAKSRRVGSAIHALQGGRGEHERRGRGDDHPSQSKNLPPPPAKSRRVGCAIHALRGCKPNDELRTEGSSGGKVVG